MLWTKYETCSSLENLIKLSQTFNQRLINPNIVKWSKTCHYSYHYALGKWLK